MDLNCYALCFKKKMRPPLTFTVGQGLLYHPCHHKGKFVTPGIDTGGKQKTTIYETWGERREGTEGLFQDEIPLPMPNFGKLRVYFSPFKITKHLLDARKIILRFYSHPLGLCCGGGGTA